MFWCKDLESVKNIQEKDKWWGVEVLTCTKSGRIGVMPSWLWLWKLLGVHWWKTVPYPDAAQKCVVHQLRPYKATLVPGPKLPLGAEWDGKDVRRWREAVEKQLNPPLIRGEVETYLKLEASLAVDDLIQYMEDNNLYRIGSLEFIDGRSDTLVETLTESGEIMYSTEWSRKDEES